MSPAGGNDVCRITVVGPTRRVDLALPDYITFAELFAAMAGHIGLDEIPAAQAPGGWVLQRLGEPPLRLDSTPGQSALRDGEILYVKPRQASLPAAAFDDVADAIAAGSRERPGRWQPADTRRVILGAGVFGLVVGAAVLALSGPPWILAVGAAGVMALLLLAAAAAASRALGDVHAGVALGWTALPYAFLAGALGPAGSTGLAHLSALDMLSGLAVSMLAGTVAAVMVDDGVPAFVGAVWAAMLGAIGAALDYISGQIGSAGAVTVAAVLAMALTPLTPAIAFRLARVDLPPVPRDADELRRDTHAVDAGQVLRRTAAADRVVTGVVSGIGMVAAAAEIVLAFAHGWLPRLMCAVLGVALLLRARVFRGRVQRLWLQAPGYAGLAGLAVGSALGAPRWEVLAVILPAVAISAAVAIAAAMWLPGRAISPFWGRAAEIMDMVLLISLVPLALGVEGVFAYIRGLSG